MRFPGPKLQSQAMLCCASHYTRLYGRLISTRLQVVSLNESDELKDSASLVV